MGVLDLLLPRRCLACAVPGAEPLCQRCAETLQPDGKAHVLGTGILCVAAFVYEGPLALAIKVVKTDGLRAGARSLARLLELPRGDVLTWVPAPAARRRRRGVELPRELAGPGAQPLLRRVGRPPEQPGLTAAERRNAPAGSFHARGQVHGTVVLVDDVRATGGTLLAAAGALRDAGAMRVLCVTLAASPGAPSAGGTPCARRAEPARWPLQT